MPHSRVRAILIHSNNCQKTGSFSKKFMLFGLSTPAGVLISQHTVPNFGSNSLLFLSHTDHIGGYCRVLRGQREKEQGGIHLDPEKPSVDSHFLGWYSHLDTLTTDTPGFQVFFLHKGRQAVFAITFLTSAHAGGSIPCFKSLSS